ncbi:MAG: hypothetical protein JSR75_06530 [Proteobacteria bacterium]|nr:hypothetical protein [Pseudomonadota bacterium]
MASKLDLVLKAFVAANRPLVRLLIGRGATFPVVAERLRQLFVDEAVAEIRARGMKPTSSAVSLLSGVHRKDLRARELGAAKDVAPAAVEVAVAAPLGLIGQIVGRWMSDASYLDGKTPRVLQRGSGHGSFDELVQGISTDVGPRAVLDEMLRLGVVRLDGERIELDTLGMVPRGDFAAMAEALGLNLADHAAAACANLVEGRNLLEQAIYVDAISPDSARLLHEAATRAWRPVLARVLRLADKRVARDAVKEEEARRQSRVRFGVYFYAEDGDEKKESE